MLKLVRRDRAQRLLLGAIALTAPLAACSMDDDVDAVVVQDDGPLYSSENRLAVPLADLPAEALDAARNHLRMVDAGLTGGDDWHGADLAPYAVPLHRPDIDGPAYYELKVVRGSDSLGFLVVSTGSHDTPVPEFNTRGATKAETLVARAGNRTRSLYRLDAAVLVAENASGEIADATWPRIPIIPTTDERKGPVDMGPWTGWKALKRDFKRGFSHEIESLRSQSAEHWDALRALHPTTPLDPNVQARTWFDIWGDSQYTSECENNWAGPNSGPGYVNDLTAKWDQFDSFRHILSNPSAYCPSGCTPTAAGIIAAWMDDQSRRWDSGPWSRPEMGRAFFRYKQAVPIDSLPFINYGYRAPYLPTSPGTTLLQPADVYDYAAEPSQTWPTPLYPVTEEPEVAGNLTPQSDMRRYLSEIGMSMGTHCNGGTGNTYWTAIPGLQRFFDDHRIPVNVSTGSNPWGEPAFRENIINSLRSTGAPGFIHTGGWSGHTEVVNAHSHCQVRQNSNGQIAWNGATYFYTNKGWGDGNVDGWISVGNLLSSTTFSPKSPWVKLQAQHSGKCVDQAGGYTPFLGLPMQQVSCHGQPNQRWIFMPQSDGSYMIRNMASQLCLDVTNSSTANNAPVGQYICYGNATQKWRAEIRSDGRFLLRSASSNKCLEMLNFATNDGAAVGQYTCDGVSSQVWDLAQ